MTIIVLVHAEYLQRHFWNRTTCMTGNLQCERVPAENLQIISSNLCRIKTSSRASFIWSSSERSSSSACLHENRNVVRWSSSTSWLSSAPGWMVPPTDSNHVQILHRAHLKHLKLGLLLFSILHSLFCSSCRFRASLMSSNQPALILQPKTLLFQTSAWKETKVYYN